MTRQEIDVMGLKKGDPVVLIYREDIAFIVFYWEHDQNFLMIEKHGASYGFPIYEVSLRIPSKEELEAEIRKGSAEVIALKEIAMKKIQSLPQPG